MVSLAKLLRIRQRIEKKYKNMGLEKFLLSIQKVGCLDHITFSQCFRTFKTPRAPCCLSFLDIILDIFPDSKITTLIFHTREWLIYQIQSTPVSIPTILKRPTVGKKHFFYSKIWNFWTGRLMWLSPFYKMKVIDLQIFPPENGKKFPISDVT